MVDNDHSIRGKLPVSIDKLDGIKHTGTQSDGRVGEQHWGTCLLGLHTDICTRMLMGKESFKCWLQCRYYVYPGDTLGIEQLSTIPQDDLHSINTSTTSEGIRHVM